MTHEVALVLAKSLQPMFDHGLVTTLSGLVKTATVQRDGGKVERFPYPFASETQPIMMTNSDLIPDSRSRAIIYFEGNDTNVSESTAQRTRMTSEVRLICWYDSSKFQVSGVPAKVDTVHTVLLSNILANLHKAKTIESPIKALNIDIIRVLDSTQRLFSNYTYKEERGQYLQAPYYAIGIDIRSTFQLSHSDGCFNKLLAVDSADECC